MPICGAVTKWLVTKYDIELNRPVETGLWVSATDAATHRSNAAGYPSGSTSYPTTSSNYELLTETHYDNYTSVPSGLSGTLNSTYINSTNFITSYNSSPLYAQQITQSTAIKGMVAWTRVKVLGSSNTFISSVMIYDNRGRVIQVQTINSTNGTDIATTQYDYSGQVLRTHQKVQKLGGTTHSYELLTTIAYDHGGRVTTIKKKLTNNGTAYAEKQILANTYDELGQLKTKQLSDATTPVYAGGLMTYDYNIRGWLLGMNRSYLSSQGQSGTTRFGFELGYDKLTNNASRNFTAAQYNGNISGMVWKSDGDDVRRKYDFSYDPANRLMKGLFEQDDATSSWNNTTMNYSMQMGNGTDPATAYDQNGNIKAMTQYGWKITAPTGIIDNLTYTTSYNSSSNTNKLLKVVDAASDPNTKLGDFKDGSNGSGDDYDYDPNGNLKLDNNKAISSITYNHLNLPLVITVTGKGTITYSYDAAGNKLSKTVVEGTSTKITTYLSGLFTRTITEWQPDHSNRGKRGLQFIAHEEGRMRVDVNNTTTPNPYDYFIKDHLGNVRMVLTDEVKSDAYTTLSFEDAQITNQNAQWENASGASINVSGVRTGRPGSMGTSGTNGSYVRMIKRSTGAIGATKLLKVMAGDRIHTSVDYYYTTTNSSTNNSGANPLSSFITGLTNAFNVNTQVSSLLKNDAATITTQLSGNSAFTSAINPSPSTSGSNQAPKAYLNILFFDDQFKFDASSSVGSKSRIRCE